MGAMSSIQTQLDIYLTKLQREETQDNHPAVVSMYAEAIARCHRLLGKPDTAYPYFVLASQKYSEHMSDRLEHLEARADEHGNMLHKYARLLWNAQDDDAKIYFDAALGSYRKGYESGNEGIKYVCYEKSLYCLIFLGDYDSALTIALETDHLEITSSLHFTDSLTKLLIKIIDSLKKESKGGLMDALSVLDGFFERLHLDRYDINPIPITDLYTLLEQKLSTLNDMNEHELETKIRAHS